MYQIILKKIEFILFCIFLLFTLNTYADLVDHFKKANNKSHENKIKNVDLIYLINLDQRPEKFQNCLDQLLPYQIYPYRFSAVNGWELSLSAINDVGLKFKKDMIGGFFGTSYLTENLKPHHEIIKNVGQTYFCHCMARGTIGIVLSHLSILQDALNSGYETIWVMEDDILVLKDPNKISNLIENLDELVGKDNWDVLFTDQDIRNVNGDYEKAYGMAKRPNFCPTDLEQYYVRKDISNDFRIIGARFGAHSMILRRSGIIKILDFFKKYEVFLPYDMDFYLPPGIKLYTVIDDIVTNQPKAISDNGKPNYLKK